MSLAGTVINGAIVLDGGVTLPGGTRVEVLPDEEQVVAPPVPETREEFRTLVVVQFSGERE